jgi:putative transposase
VVAPEEATADASEAAGRFRTSGPTTGVVPLLNQRGSATPEQRVGATPGDAARDFTAEAPNELWLTDITEHWTRGGQALPLRDQGRVLEPDRRLGHRLEDEGPPRRSPRSRWPSPAEDVDVAGCILHSDRGSQFRARKVHRALARHGLVGSMGQVGAAGDNAAMESFFALLQKNVLDRRSWNTRDELRIAIVTWIERTYHRRRRQARLGRLTPIEYETIMTPRRQPPPD